MKLAVWTRGCAVVFALGGCSSAVSSGGGFVADAGDVALGFQDTGAAPDAKADVAVTDAGADAVTGAVADAASDAVADVAVDSAPDALKDANLPQTCPGAEGCSCTTGADCTNGACIDTPDGKRCAQTCGSVACASGQNCVNLPELAIEALVCVPTWGKLCYPCNATKDCAEPWLTGALCVNEGTLGSFCGAPCTTVADCPSGYACQVGQSPEGPKALQCIRVTSDGSGVGTCSCTAAAKANGLSTACYGEQKDLSGKVVGNCPGARTCGPTGLGACILIATKPDVCDGVDNDCNGQIDDNATGCGTGETCLMGKCAGGCGSNNGGCDANATCLASGGKVTCTCKTGFSGDGTSCLADCALPWGGNLASGASTTAWHDTSVACGGTCMSETRTCTNGTLSGSFSNSACAVANCPGQCPALNLNFDWGTSGGGPCHVTLPAGTASNWYYTATTDLFLGGVYATCDTASGSWQIAQQKCVPANGATTCFPKGTKCDGSGPALFPYPHCWTCCTWTDAMPGVCN